MSMLINPFAFGAGGGGVSDSGPELISDLQLWLNANTISGLSDDDQITTWEDDSGNGRDATGVQHIDWKPKYRSTDGPNSKPAVRMGTDNPEAGGWFTLADFLTGYTSGHIFVVVKTDIDPSSAIDRAGPPTRFGSANSNADLYPFHTDSKVYDAFGSTVRKTTNDFTTSLATWHVYESRTASAAWSLRINGATSGGDFFSTATNTVGWTTTPRIGSHHLSDTHLCGMIAEIIFYSRVLDGTETGDIYDYLETKYGITLP